MTLRTGLNRGTVTRATAAGVYVKLADLYGEAEIGPLDAIVPMLRRPARNTGTANGPDAHTHVIAQIDNDVDRFTAGDRVLVASVGPGDWIVIGRIGTGVNK